MRANAKPKRVVVLGATGSIGQSARKAARALGGRVEVVGLSSHRQTSALLEAAREFMPAMVCVGSAKEEAAARSAGLPEGVRCVHGGDGLIELAAFPDADLVLIAIVGTAGLRPALAAIEAGKDLALASKEILVMAGGIVMEAARRKGVNILPVDSEHNAIFQCLNGEDPDTVHRLLLTCSGGPFLDLPAHRFPEITPELALNHPTWSMGRKITVDSATLFNKGLEMIEARWLFGVPMDRIDVVIHPRSIVHSMVEFVDGSVLAQMSVTDMIFPIQYAFTYPERVDGGLKRLDFSALGNLEFRTPREADFPSLGLARLAGERGGTLPAVLNAANETAVDAFLSHRLLFPGIWETVRHCMETVPFEAAPDLDALIKADLRARETAAKFIANS